MLRWLLRKIGYVKFSEYQIVYRWYEEARDELEELRRQQLIYD